MRTIVHDTITEILHIVLAQKVLLFTWPYKQAYNNDHTLY